MSEKNIIAVLRSANGETKIFFCPRCGHFVESCDVVWKQDYINTGELGEVAGCVYCAEEE